VKDVSLHSPDREDIKLPTKTVTDTRLDLTLPATGLTEGKYTLLFGAQNTAQTILVPAWQIDLVKPPAAPDQPILVQGSKLPAGKYSLVKTSPTPLTAELSDDKTKVSLKLPAALPAGVYRLFVDDNYTGFDVTLP